MPRVHLCPICNSSKWMFPSRWGPRGKLVCERPSCIYQRTKEKAMNLTKIASILALILGAPLVASAQTTPPRNPTQVEFTCPDHDRDDQHELKIIEVQGTNRVIITTILLGDPAPDPANPQLVRTSINVQPIAFGEYVARVNALVTTSTGTILRSDDSAESNNFFRVPGGPSNVRVQ